MAAVWGVRRWGADLGYRLRDPVPGWTLLAWTAVLVAMLGPALVRALGRGGEPRRWLDLLTRVAIQAVVALTVSPLAWMQRRVVRPVVLWLGRVRG